MLLDDYILSVLLLPHFPHKCNTSLTYFNAHIPIADPCTAPKLLCKFKTDYRRTSVHFWHRVFNNGTGWLEKTWRHWKHVSKIKYLFSEANYTFLYSAHLDLAQLQVCGFEMSTLFTCYKQELVRMWFMKKNT